MARTAPRSGRAAGPGSLALEPLLAAVMALAGCASDSHHVVPTQERLGRVSAGEVEVPPTRGPGRSRSGWPGTAPSCELRARRSRPDWRRASSPTWGEGRR